MNRKGWRKSSAPSKSDSSARLAALEAFILETEGLTPLDMERINAEHGLAPGDDLAEAFRLDRFLDKRSKAADLGSRAPPPQAAPVHRAVRDDGGGVGRAIRVKVHGRSMIDAGLNDGDWIDIDVDAQPLDGDIVLAEIDGAGQALRTLRIIGGAIVLVAANREIGPISICDPDRLIIHGVARPRPPAA